MFKKIAIATDGSPLAAKAVQAASDIAAKYGSELTVFHVLMHGEPPEALRRFAEVEHLIPERPKPEVASGNITDEMMATRSVTATDSIDYEVVRAVGERVLRQAKDRARENGVKSVSGEILEGDSADQIVAAAKRVGAELIVLGSRGLGPLTGVLLGSVSQKVSQESECACLIVK